MVLAILIAIGVSLTPVSAFDLNFNFSSDENSDGDSIVFENGNLTIQGVEFAIPEGFELDDNSKKLAEQAEDMDDAKYSACKFTKDNEEIVIHVFFADGDFENLTNVTSDQVNKTINKVNGLYEANHYGDNTPTFTYLKDGKIVKINAPNDEIIESVIK